MAKKKMTEKDKRDWDLLYNYVKSNIMGYDQNQALSSTMVLRLKGLLSGKFIENNGTANKANYSYEVILNTFKFCSTQIQNALRTNNFNSEMHKFLYVVKIVENNINDVYMKMRNSQKAKEEAKNTTVEIPMHQGAEFKPKEKRKDKFSDLW